MILLNHRFGAEVDAKARDVDAALEDVHLSVSRWQSR